MEIIQRSGLEGLKTLILLGDLDLPFFFFFFCFLLFSCVQTRVFFVLRIRKQTSIIESLAVV